MPQRQRTHVEGTSFGSYYGRANGSEAGRPYQGGEPTRREYYLPRVFLALKFSGYPIQPGHWSALPLVMPTLPCVLLVDDDPTTNFLNHKLLLRLGVTEEVRVAHNGQEALAELHAYQN